MSLSRSVVSVQCFTLAGNASRRRKLPRLYANANSCSRTWLSSKSWQLSRVQFRASLPSLMHCSNVRAHCRQWNSFCSHSDRSGPPIVAIPALLELARWCRRRRTSGCGADPCQTSRTTDQSPPALSETEPSCGSRSILDRPAGRSPATDVDDTEPDRGPEAGQAGPTAGGGS